MARIFINYRRDDSPGVAGRLFDHLAVKFPRRDLFMDVDAMKPGMDFAKQLDIQVSQCNVVLAVIGPRWLDAHDQAGKRRLDADRDYVRIELASALKRDIAVIPVLVDGAVMPAEASLPDDLKALAYRHALELRHTRFNADADAIVTALEDVVPRRRWPWAVAGAGVVIAVAVIVAVAVLWPKLTAKPGPKPPVAVAAKPGPANPPAAPAPAPPMQAAAPPAQTAAPPAQPAAPPAQTAAPPVQPAAAASSAVQDSSLPGVKIGEMLPGLAFRGSVLRVTEIAADPAVCQSACRAETRCAAWTYTQPPASDQSAHCSLKAVIPASAADTCCTSGVERIPPSELRVPPPVPASVTGALPGIELEGGTYTYFGGTKATPQGCQAACQADGQCLAWDYVRPGIYSSDARCFLKNRASMQVASPCCIAGFERQVAAKPAPVVATPASGTGPLVNTDLRGSSYRNFELSADNWSLCQSACKADTQCLAWTYVHPGLQGPNARCWLKNKIPDRSANSCCTSGIERPQAQ